MNADRSSFAPTVAHVQRASSQSLAPDLQELVEILDRYLDAVESGYSVDVDQLVARYPEFANPLREYLEGLELLHGVDPLGVPQKEVEDAIESDARRRLGDYEIIREIGRGGMGVVYEAQQISLRRKVALKVLPFAAVLDQRQILRFENEARAAAQLHHPNIVPVHGVGSDRGVHFYAMQFIEGRSLRDALEEVRETNVNTKPCHRKTDTTAHIDSIGAFSTTSTQSDSRQKHARALAKLGIEVAEALHEAHECGVVHRDIKPSNLLLDRHGKLWITDFGLARCQTNGSVTNSGDIVGTLQYMSPEQSQGRTALVDHRTDVYSLGVTLYELLTLQRPFVGDSNAGILRQIELGQYEPIRNVNPAVPRDLENVIAKAMAIAREERYTTALELADDLRRFIDGKPIRAKPPNAMQRMTKWAGRHRTAVAAACLLLFFTSICLTVATVVVSRDRAQTVQKLERNRQTFEDFGLRIAEWLKGVSGTENVRRALLSEVLNSQQQLLEQVGDSPAMRADAALTLSKIASIHEQLGDSTTALAKHRKAMHVLQSLVRDDPENPEHRAELARCQSQIGLLLRAIGRLREAESLFRQAVAALQELCARYPQHSQYALNAATAWCNLGLQAMDSNNSPNAQRHFTRAYETLKQLNTQHPDDGTIVNALASASGNLAMLHAKSDAAEAIAWSEESLRHRRRAASVNSTDTHAQRLFAAECSNLATLYCRAGRVEESIATFREAVSLQRQLVKLEGGVVAHRRDLAITLNNLGRALSSNQDLVADARTSFKEALSVQEQLCADFPADVSLLSRLGGIHNNLAMGYRQQSEFALAEKHFRTGLTCQQKAFNLAPNVTEYRDYFSRNLFNYARLLRGNGKPFQAAAVTQKRATLWPDDAAQLHSVAKELTLCVRKMPLSDTRRQGWIDKTAAVLRQATDAGWTPATRAEHQAFADVLGDRVNAPPLTEERS